MKRIITTLLLLSALFLLILSPSVSFSYDEDEEEIKPIICFVLEEEGTPEDYWPAIGLFEEDYFYMVVNLYEGLGSIIGEWKWISDRTIQCKVIDRSFEGFIGDKVDEFNFFMENNILVYQGYESIGTMDPGDVLIEKGMYPKSWKTYVDIVEAYKRGELKN
jgi:hypothetical protein